MEGGKEQNYWPGFVDALSNVVLTLVFVLVIFVFALAMASNKIERKLQELQPVVKEHASLSEENIALKNRVQALTAEVEQLKKQVSGGQAKNSNLADSANSQNVASNHPAQITAEANRITLRFDESVAELDEPGGQKFDALANAIIKKTPKFHAQVYAYIGKESYSMANRNAYFRAVILRSRLLEKNQVPADRIEMKTLPMDRTGGSRVEVTFIAD
jgi:hypothetical protein